MKSFRKQASSPSTIRWCVLAAAFMAVPVLPASDSAAMNGFDVSNATIPVAEIPSGGPPRDGIPAIDRPRAVRFLDDADMGSATVRHFPTA